MQTRSGSPFCNVDGQQQQPISNSINGSRDPNRKPIGSFVPDLEPIFSPHQIWPAIFADLDSGHRRFSSSDRQQWIRSNDILFVLND
ncbi:hypothetical protein ACLOJK_027400 [Asimina triloba]